MQQQTDTRSATRHAPPPHLYAPLDPPCLRQTAGTLGSNKQATSKQGENDGKRQGTQPLCVGALIMVGTIGRQRPKSNTFHYLPYPHTPYPLDGLDPGSDRPGERPHPGKTLPA